MPERGWWMLYVRNAVIDNSIIDFGELGFHRCLLCQLSTFYVTGVNLFFSEMFFDKLKAIYFSANKLLLITCGVVDLRSSDALRRETKYVNAQQ